MQRGRDADRPSSSNRRLELVRIAYRHIAERGFEGLRVRDVASEAGLNNATLHYYFPTKETLIQGVVEYLLREFATSRVPRPTGGPAPLEELRHEFMDLRYRFREMPDMFVVLTELAIRSRRDPAIARLLAQLDAGWHGYLVSLLERGVREGVFRSDLDRAATAEAIMVQLKGIGYQAMGKPNSAQIDRLISQLALQIERWLTP